MHGSENNNSHLKVYSLDQNIVIQKFSCLFQIFIKYDEMLIATSTMLRVLFFAVLHVTGTNSSGLDKSKEWQIEEINCKGSR
jgi:hypothetical protein